MEQATLLVEWPNRQHNFTSIGYAIIFCNIFQCDVQNCVNRSAFGCTGVIVFSSFPPAPSSPTLTRQPPAQKREIFNQKSMPQTASCALKDRPLKRTRRHSPSFCLSQSSETATKPTEPNARPPDQPMLIKIRPKA